MIVSAGKNRVKSAKKQV